MADKIPQPAKKNVKQGIQSILEIILGVILDFASQQFKRSR